MERPNEPTLLGLPAELRSRILKFVVYHEETGGIISPSPDYVYTKFVTLISGQRFVVFDVGQGTQPDMPDDTHIPTQNGGNQYPRLKKMWEDSPNVAYGHFCKLDCLVPPTISCVNKQLRSESLSIFYGMNRFHIELANFELTKEMCNTKREGLTRAPCDWWRTIGDSNLNLVRELTIVGQKEYRNEGVAIEYVQSQGTELTRTWKSRAFWRHRYGGYENQAAEATENRDLQVNLNILSRIGPHYRILEEIVAALETPARPGRYLRGRDHERTIAQEAHR